MKKTFWLLYFGVAACNFLYAQPDPILAFNTLLRDCDLNADMQQGYAITAMEYDQLRTAWQNLSPEHRSALHGTEHIYWEDVYVPQLLRDLIAGATWQEHVKKMSARGAQGLALTLSRSKNPITVAEARNHLADLLYKGASMFNHGRFQIPEDIMVAARTRIGDKAVLRLEHWERMINTLQLSSDEEKAEAVNGFFNHVIAASSDKGAAQGYDYWQSPIETLARGLGDCDDFAIAKYVSLRMLGIPAEQLRVGIVTQTHTGPHAVLLFFAAHETEPRVLDNLGSSRLGSDADAILSLRARKNLDGMAPLWGMNEILLTRFRDDLSEEKVSSYPYQKFRAVTATFINSYRLLPPSAWGKCEKGYACICYRLGIHQPHPQAGTRPASGEDE
jgi:predicted transglutaminase-like cysteine proteinase